MKLNYDSPKELKDFLDSRGLGMRKKFGQNFLVNGRTRERLIEALELNPGEAVWEVGPGLGAMTAGLLDGGGRVTAFEIDRAFSKVLRELFGENKSFTLIEGDVLKTWPAEASKTAVPRPAFLGNLPYNIGASLIADFIEKGFFFSRMVVTVQKETALRMAARPSSKDYSSFSVLCASVYRVRPLMTIKGPSFYPAPRVDSQGVLLEILPEEEQPLRPALFHPLVRSLFSSRRKTIKNNLTNFASSVMIETPGDKAAAAALDACGIQGDRRAETLLPADFGELAAAIEKIRKNGI